MPDTPQPATAARTASALTLVLCMATLLASLAALRPAAARAAPSAAPSAASGVAQTANAISTEPIPIEITSRVPIGRRLSPARVLAIASALPSMRRVRREYPGAYPGVYLKGTTRWQVSFFTLHERREVGQVTIADSSGRVLEAWTGFQVAWTMARGYPGAFGEHVNSVWLWIPMCLLFLAPFLDVRRPLSIVNLDLLALLSFSISLAFFNHADIYASVPLAYPPLVYLLARMLWIALRRPRRAGAPARRAPTAQGTRSAAGSPPPRAGLRMRVPAMWLAVGTIFLIGFRIGLNVSDSNVIDVGYAGVIGAQRIVTGERLYGGFPSDNEHGDTYGPFNYEAYVPFQQVFGWSGTWNDLPAAHAAAICFDLLACALMFLLGRRLRGPTLGVALAYGWVSYPFTLYTLESNANDSLLAVMVLAALLAASYRPLAARGARGGLAALAGLTKFAPLALAPILALDGLPALARRARVLALGAFAAGFALLAVLAFLPVLGHDSLHEIYERTLVYQANRGSPFSLWGLYGAHTGELIAEIVAVALALALAVVPRRQGLVGLAAGCGAIMLALQLTMEHWFYLYIPWFFPLVLLAAFGAAVSEEPAPAASASGPARSSLPVAVASS